MKNQGKKNGSRMFLWVVTAVDIGDSCDGKARVLKICRNKEEAVKYMHDDMTDYDNSHNCVLNYSKNCAWTDFSETNGCIWNLEKININSNCIISEDEIKKSEQVLIDNGIEKDEAQVVLQALGYTLLGIELYPEEK